MRDRAARAGVELDDGPDPNLRGRGPCRSTIPLLEHAQQNRVDNRCAAAPKMFRAAARYFARELSALVRVTVFFTAQSPLSGSGVGFGPGVGCASLCNLRRVLGSSTQVEYLISVAVARSNSATAAFQV